MKVIFVAPTYFDEQSIIGGGERYVQKFAEALSQKCDLQVISFGPRKRSFESNGVRYLIFKYRLWGQFTQTNPFSLAHYRFIRKNSFDVLHTHQMCTWVTDLACLAAKRRGRVSVTTDHGGGGAWVLNNRIQVFPKYQCAIGQSDIASALLEPHFPGRVVTLKGGVNLEDFTPAPVEAQKKKQILFVGRLLQHKGVHTLIEGFKKAQLSGYELLIVGRPMDQDYFSRLQDSARDFPVRFITNAEDALLKQCYRESRITVLPSETVEGSSIPPELMGFTSLESQASGTPVIVSDAGPMHEFISPGNTGFVFENKNPDALGDALRKADELYNESDSVVSNNCRNWVAQFSWDALADRHLALYRTLLEKQENRKSK